MESVHYFYVRKQLMLSVHLSHRSSVRLSVHPSVHKFEGGHLKRGHWMREGWAKFSTFGQQVAVSQ